jgi:microcystin-dependent protein
MSDVFLGEIRIFPFNFAPAGWAMCDGQVMAISQNTALFSLLGTQYGGDGKSIFALPNLQGRAPMFYGNGPGLTPHNIGEVSGTPGVTLDVSQMPAHTHSSNGDTSMATSTSPFGNLPAVPAVNPRFLPDMYTNPNTAPNVSMLAGNALPAGGGSPHNNLQPYLVLNFCIALQGIFPSRS